MQKDVLYNTNDTESCIGVKIGKIGRVKREKKKRSDKIVRCCWRRGSWGGGAI